MDASTINNRVTDAKKLLQNVPRTPITLVEPQFVNLKFGPITTQSMQWSLHSPSKRLLRDIFEIFPTIQLDILANVMVLVTFQKSVHELIVVNSQVDRERDALLLNVC
jgi:hypothetical protein